MRQKGPRRFTPLDLMALVVAFAAAVRYGGPYVFEETPPAGLLGLIGGIGPVATPAAVRRVRAAR